MKRYIYTFYLQLASQLGSKVNFLSWSVQKLVCICGVKQATNQQQPNVSACAKRISEIAFIRVDGNFMYFHTWIEAADKTYFLTTNWAKLPKH